MSIEHVYSGTCAKCTRRTTVSCEDHGYGEGQWRRCPACKWAAIIDPRRAVPETCPECSSSIVVWDPKRCPGCDGPIELTYAVAYN